MLRNMSGEFLTIARCPDMGTAEGNSGSLKQAAFGEPRGLASCEGLFFYFADKFWTLSSACDFCDISNDKWRLRQLI